MPILVFLDGLESLLDNLSHGLMGTLYRYGEPPSSHFLDGEYRWWNQNHEDGEIVPSHISQIEQNPPPSWLNWRRQRLIPLLRYWVIPCAWSPAFFIAGIIAFSLDQINGISPTVGLISMLLCPMSLGISLLYFSSKSDDGNLVNMAVALISRTRLIWVLVLLFMSIWLIYNKPSSDNPMWFLIGVPTFILWLEWFTLGTVAHSHPPSRWLLPVKVDSLLPMDELTKKGWVWLQDTDRIRPGNVAKYRTNNSGTFLLKVIHYSGTYFLALEWWTIYGTRTDPWLKYTSNETLPLKKLMSFMGLKIDFDTTQTSLRSYNPSLWDSCSINWPLWSESVIEDE